MLENKKFFLANCSSACKNLALKGEILGGYFSKILMVIWLGLEPPKTSLTVGLLGKLAAIK